MHKIVLLLSFCLLGMKTYSQQQYFVYIQTDNNQPFYVRMNEKIFSSSETGYLILSRLSEKSYDFFIGFARSAYPEQQFRLVSNKDKGYQLKNFGEKGWGLVDLQSQEVIMNTNSASVAMLSGERKTDPFSVMLASVVNDSAILYTQPKPAEPVAAVTAEKKKTAPVETDKQETLVTQTAVVPVRETTATAQPTETNKPETSLTTSKETDKVAETPIEKDNTAIVATSTADSAVIARADSIVSKSSSTVKPAIEKPFITRIKESRDGDGYQAIYLEQYNYSTDTIDILIPSEATIGKAPQQKQPQPVVAAPVVEAKNNEVAGKEVVQKDTGKASIALQMGSVTDTFAVKKKTIVMTNSDCKNFATESDVDKLRIKLLGEKTIDEKLSTARKYYRNKCFTVKQLRALTELFPTDETKYRFLDLSYAFASDSGNFYLLEEVMGEDYYKNRFRAMIGK